MICVITYPTPKNVKDLVNLKECKTIIAVDQAHDYLIEQKIKPNVLIGDFDSIKTLDIPKDVKVIKLPKIKDVTDTKAAIEYAYKIKGNKVYLIGGIGGNRMEHFLSNIFLFGTYQDLVVINETNKIYGLKKGSHKLPKKDKYISLLPWPKALVSISGFEYELKNYKMDFYDDLGISNTWIKDEAKIDVLEGFLLVIEGMDK